MLGLSAYLTDTVSLPELVWTVVSGMGLYFNFTLTRDAVSDLKALRAARINSVREFASVSGVMAESLKLFIQFVFFTLGAVSMLLPPAQHDHIPTFQWVLTTVFVILVTAISGAAYLEKIRRRRLIELITEYEDLSA